MKILFSPCHYVYDEYSGGSEYSWAFEIAHRVALRYKQSMVVTGFSKLIGKKEYGIIEVQKNKKTADLSLWNALKFSVKYLRETERQLTKEFDIVHHVLPFSINNTFNLSLLIHKNVNFVVGPVQSPLDYHDYDKKINKKSFKTYLLKTLRFCSKALLKYLSNQTLARARAVVVINEHTKNILLKNGVGSEIIHLIPPGIDINKYKYVPMEQKSRDVIEILVVCYLVQRKAVDLVVEAINRVVIQNKKIILRILGDGPQMQSLIEFVKHKGLQNRVIFEGFINNNEIQNYYSRAHIFVSMSRDESWGQMYLEAMAAGLAVISAKNTGSISIIENGLDGLLIEKDDVGGLVLQITKLVNNLTLLADLGKHAREKAEKVFDWDTCIIPQYLDIYSRININK